MESFKDLDFQADDVQIIELIELVTNNLPPQWSRAYEQESNAGLPEKIFCFERVGDNIFPAAGLFIFEQGKGKWNVPNVIPKETSQLSRKEYNGILTEFYNNCIVKYSNTLDIKAELSSGDLTDADIVGKNAAPLLKSFSNLANKSTGSSHPMDQKRWFRFIEAACRSKDYIDTELLKRLLKTQGWSENSAQDLAIQFEFARDFLEYLRSGQ